MLLFALLPAALAAGLEALDLPGHIPISAYEFPYVQVPALSPEGRYDAWIRGEGDAAEVVVERVDGSEPLRVLVPSDKHPSGVAWPLAAALVVWLGPDEASVPWLVDLETGARTPIARPCEKVGVLGADPAHKGDLDLIRREHRKEVFERLHPPDGQRTTLYRGPWHSLVLFDPESGEAVAVVDEKLVRGDQTVDRWVSRETVFALDPSGPRPVMTVKNPFYVSFGIGKALGGGRVAWNGAVDTDKAAPSILDLATGVRRTLYEPERADVDATLWNGDGLCAVREYAERRRWKALDPSFAPDLERLSAVLSGDWRIYEGSPRVWLVSESAPTHAIHWFAYLRDTGAVRRIGPPDSSFDNVPWRPMQALAFPARDGLPLTAYLTTPSPERFGPPPYPVVVTVHGGPWWARADWSWDMDTQRLADLGHAVLAVNFRGSGGFGKKFADAAKGEWGRAMSYDLLDALAHAAATGQVDPTKAAIDGASYGGYAVLAAMTMEPGAFRCGVAVAPEGSLVRRSLFGALDFGTIGSTRPERIERSPDQHVDALVDPVLVWVGAHDRAVPWAQVSRFVRRARAEKKPLTLVRDERGGHGPSDMAGLIAWTATREAFLQGCLGGDAPDVESARTGSGLREVRTRP